MNQKLFAAEWKSTFRCMATRVVFVLALLPCAMFAASNAHAQAVYSTPEAAAQALVSAIASNDDAALRTVLGHDHNRFIPADSVGEEDIYAFLGAWAKQHRIVNDPAAPGGHASAHVEVGDSGWTLPMPIVESARGWQFDMPAARDEMLTRRLGRNERSAILTSLAIVDAQQEFRKTAQHYAARFISTPGRHDGLYWPTSSGEPDSPLGPLAATMPPTTAPPDAYHGYHFRLLSAQGPHAAGGARSYLEDGVLARGFGILAWPARYGQTGVMSFVVNQDGKVYQKNIGPSTPRAAATIRAFDPDESWGPVSP